MRTKKNDSKFAYWDDMPTNLDIINDTISEVLPENANVDENTKIEFYKHTVKNGKNVVETIDVKHEIIVVNGCKILKIYEASKYVFDNIDVHFFVEIKENKQL